MKIIYYFLKVIILLANICGIIYFIYNNIYFWAIVLLLFLIYLLFIYKRIDGFSKLSEFEKRTIYATNIVLFFIFLLIIRLISVQIFDGYKYKDLVSKQITKEENIFGTRGTICDINGKNLVFNKNIYTVAINPSAIDDRKGKARLGFMEILDQNFIIKDKKKLLKEIIDGSKKGRKYKKIAKNIIESDKEIVDKIIKKYHMTRNEISIHKEVERVYYRKDMYSDILGFIGKNKNTPETEGLFGIEKQYQKYLKQKNLKKINFYANSRRIKLPMSKQSIQAELNGNTVYMTIDNDIQGILEEELSKKYESSKSEEAYGIIMDPNNGRILALSSFRKNKAFHRNPIFQNQYEPGSTFKPLIVAGALEKKLITRNSTFDVGDGKIKKYGFTIRESSRNTKGILTTDQVLEKSSNVGMVLISDKYTDKSFEDTLRTFGLYDKTNVDFPGEIKPFTRSSRKWNGLTKNNMAFGQGIAVSPIQLITAFASVINGGILYKPYLVDRIEDENGVVIRRNLPREIRRTISPKVSKDLREILTGVVDTGTAKRGKINGYRIGGKTGTAQLSSRGGYMKENYLASFIGFFPADKPKYLILVMYLKPKGETIYEKYGGATAAPVFADIAKRIIKTKNVLASNLKSISSVKKLNNNKDVLECKALMPDLIGRTPREVIYIFKNLDAEIEISGVGKVSEQFPKAGESLEGVNKIKIILD